MPPAGALQGGSMSAVLLLLAVVAGLLLSGILMALLVPAASGRIGRHQCRRGSRMRLGDSGGRISGNAAGMSENVDGGWRSFIGFLAVVAKEAYT